MSYVIAYLLTFAVGLVLMLGYGNPDGWGSYFVGAAGGIALASLLP